MKNINKTLLVTALFGGISLGLSPLAHADLSLVQNGNFNSFTGTAPGAGTSTQLAAHTLSDWVNNTQVNTPGTGYNGGVGYNFVYTPNGSGNYDYTPVAGDLPLYNTSNSGLDSITQPSGYTGNIVGLDGAYQVGALTQTISGLIAGQTYKVDFDYAGAQEFGYTDSTHEAVKVSLGDSAVEETPLLANAYKGFTGWNSESLEFTADSSSEVLSFLAVGTPNGQPPITLLADVSLTATPEPSSLIGGGLVLLAFGVGSLRMFRKQKQA